MGFVSSETKERCALTEHLAGDKRGEEETVSENETSENEKAGQGIGIL